MRVNDPKITFGAAAAAAGETAHALRGLLDRGDASLSTEAGRSGGGWRRFTPVDVLRVAVQQRLVRYGVPPARADEILREHFDGRIKTLLAGFPDATVDFLPVLLGARVLVVLRDGRAGLLDGLPGDALRVVTAAGAGDTVQGGHPHPGSEWVLDEMTEDFIVLRLGAIARGVVSRLGAA